MTPISGVLLFAHGARDPLWARPFEAVAARVRSAHPEATVVLGFLEFMAPDLAGAGRQLAEAGCRQVEVVPLFLGTGGHVRRDLPALMQQLAEAYPQVAWTLRPAIGEEPAVVAAMAEAAAAHLKAGRA